MTDAFRLWFVVSYALGFVFFPVLIFRFRARRPTVEQRVGPLPPPLALISWLIPPIILLTGVEISAVWIPLRMVGVGLSLYATAMMPWATWVLGRSYVPGPAVLQEHALVSAGPFRLVRHPIYSAVAALWLGAALGTLNWLLLVLWPLIVAALRKGARAEEEMLRVKFGNAYDAYARQKGRLVPKLGGRGNMNRSSLEDSAMGKRFSALTATMILTLLGAAALAQSAAHTMVTPNELVWADMPSLPPGAKVAVIQGPLNEAVPFTLRLKLPRTTKYLLTGIRGSSTPQ
jgi:protein-S-isoprenylcysteine O-methyltransferase Ste14